MIEPLRRQEVLASMANRSSGCQLGRIGASLAGDLAETETVCGRRILVAGKKSGVESER